MHGSDRRTSSATPDGLGPGEPGADGPRHVAGARRPLPSGRAVVGGLLVSLSAVVVFAAWAGAQERPTTTVVVAARDLDPGTRVAPEDVEVRRVDLPSELAGGTYAAPDELVGSVVLGPVAAGELLQPGSVRTAPDGAGGQEFSFTVDSDTALAGTVRAGETVELLATYGTGADARTEVLARDARVLRVRDAGGAGLGSSGRLVLTVSLDAPGEVLDVAHAAQVAVITLVRGGERSAATTTDGATTDGATTDGVTANPGGPAAPAPIPGGAS